MPRALIVGINGFAGQHLARELMHAKWDIVGLGHAPTSKVPAPYYACDLNDAQRVRSVLQEARPDAIVHLASVTPVSRPPTDAYYRVNVLGTLNLLDATREHAPQALILLITSSAMFGRPSEADSTITEASPLLPVNAYGVSKATQHLLGYQYADQYKLRIIRVCPFNFIGPDMPQGLVAADFASQLARIELGQQPATISVGDLDAVRDFLDVRDAARAMRLLLEATDLDDHYILSSSQGHKVQHLLDTLVALSSTPVTIQQRAGAAAANPIPIQIGQNAALRSAVNWQPEYSFEQSLEAVLNTYRQRLGKASSQ